ncbi:hypothetical protein JHK87_016620 [Glycine soja]|nr:hypothetical protein JHK87_016620 [Glycine soja]
MWRGVSVAYTIVIICYLSVAVFGFWGYGNVVDDDILITLEHPNWLIAIANFMVFVHVLGSFQIPGILWLKAKRPQRWSFHWIASWVILSYANVPSDGGV